MLFQIKDYISNQQEKNYNYEIICICTVAYTVYSSGISIEFSVNALLIIWVHKNYDS